MLGLGNLGPDSTGEIQHQGRARDFGRALRFLDDRLQPGYLLPGGWRLPARLRRAALPASALLPVGECLLLDAGERRRLGSAQATALKFTEQRLAPFKGA